MRPPGGRTQWRLSQGAHHVPGRQMEAWRPFEPSLIMALMARSSCGLRDDLDRPLGRPRQLYHNAIDHVTSHLTLIVACRGSCSCRKGRPSCLAAESKAAGPLLSLATWGFVGSVATEAFCMACSICSVSCWLARCSAKKCCATCEGRQAVDSEDGRVLVPIDPERCWIEPMLARHGDIQSLKDIAREPWNCRHRSSQGYCHRSCEGEPCCQLQANQVSSLAR